MIIRIKWNSAHKAVGTVPGKSSENGILYIGTIHFNDLPYCIFSYLNSYNIILFSI